MKWTKPDFQVITLNMEVTAYVNTDEKGQTQPAIENRRAETHKVAATPATAPPRTSKQ